MTQLSRLAVLGGFLLAACAPAPAPEPEPETTADLGGKVDNPEATDTGATLRYASYDVMFTNPVCRSYAYDSPVATVDGSQTLAKKPKNVYCSAADSAASAARPSSPQYRLLEWLRPLGAGDEVFLAYLSFSNRAVGDELCAAVGRGAQVRMILDATSSASDALVACGGEVMLRGHHGTLGYAHNKVLLINPNADPNEPGQEHMRMAFSSGNMSSGAVLHHENWHFIEVARKSYFAEAHRCLMQAQLDEEIAGSKATYRTFMKSCRAAITYPQEDDIKAFFVPDNVDSQAITGLLLQGIRTAASVDLGVHRFCYPDMVDALEQRLETDPEFQVRMVADDDLYWLRPLAGPSAVVGNNMLFEAGNVKRLQTAGGDRFAVRYFETNHGEHLLHHNKYLIYRDGAGKATALLCGAANLTAAGFKDNFENIYWVKIPKVLEAFDTQFARVWDGRKASPDEQDPPVATPPEKMPARDGAVH